MLQKLRSSPQGVVNFLEQYLEICLRRPGDITWTELHAWQEVTKSTLCSLEIDLLFKLENVYHKVISKD